MQLLEVIEPGLLTTIQDTGRPGYRRYGVPVCGALDPVSSRMANYLVGNESDAAVLEITLLGPTLRFLGHSAFALSGADLSPTLNEVSIELNETQFATRGDTLRFGERRLGARCYLAVSGGFMAAPILGSRSTHIRSQWGGIQGFPLQKGQLLRAQVGSLKNSRVFRLPTASLFDPEIRIVPGPEHEDFLHIALTDAPWTVSSQSDRAGLRLIGRSIPAVQKEMISSPVDVGTIQLPRSGEPLILLNDGSSIGGYPRVASVVQSDLPRLAQAVPNHQIALRWVTREASLELYAEYRSMLNKLVASPTYTKRTPP